VFFDMVEFQGFAYGLSWPGSYTCTFYSCSYMTLGTIVNPGDGVIQTWQTCQYGETAIPGWAWIYNDPGMVCVIPHPVEGGVHIGHCGSGDPDEPIVSFCAGIGGYIGDDPCAISTDAGSWGAIKAMFE
jgi:hypothetical protein